MISNDVVCATSKASDQTAYTRSLIRLEYSISVKLLTEKRLECLSLKGDCTGSSEPTLVKMPHYWKTHVAAHLLLCARVHIWQVRSQYYAPQREASETSSDSCQLRSFSKWGLLLKESICFRFLHCLTKIAA